MIPYKPEEEKDGPLRLCPPGKTCSIDGVYSPPYYPCRDRTVIKVPDNCDIEIPEDGTIATSNASCIPVPDFVKKILRRPNLETKPRPLTPKNLSDREFRNWPDPYTPRNWWFPKWPADPERECGCQ
jgi:hypothetical protein